MPSAGRLPTGSRPSVARAADGRGSSRTAGGAAAARDDIPLARRTVSPALKPRRSWRMAGIGAGSVLVAATVAGLTFQQPLRRLLAPPPVQGLRARLSLDGRLLGHFPYAEAPSSALVAIGPGVQMQRDAAAALRDLQDAALADGVDIRVLSAFRPIALQKQIFFDVKSERNQSARERAQVSAPPGFSEHSTGYAVDLGDGRRPDANLSPRFEGTEAFAWLLDNANRFHFEMSFPRGNRQGVSYEPWHWRFEGSADALRIFEAAQRFQG